MAKRNRRAAVFALASTAIRLLAQVTSLKFFARFRGGEIGCSDWPSCGDGTS